MSTNLDDALAQVKGYNAQATNRWDTFQMPYSGDDMLNFFNKYYQSGQNALQSQGSTAVATATNATAKRANAAGYGGSVKEDMISGAGENVAANTTNALTTLKGQELQQMPSLLQTANTNAMNVTGQAQNVDLENVRTMLQKYGLLSSDAQAADSQPGIFDDIMAGFGAATKVAGIPLGTNSNVLSKILGI